ncbi:MAG: hypothetical protein R3C12_15715 [Planctomycetaceae bacterium]
MANRINNPALAGAGGSCPPLSPSAWHLAINDRRRPFSLGQIQQGIASGQTRRARQSDPGHGSLASHKQIPALMATAAPSTSPHGKLRRSRPTLRHG